MDTQAEKIRKFSKVVHTILSVVFVILIVTAALEFLAWIWTALNLNTATVVINGKEMEAPLLLKLGDLQVVLPVMWTSEFDFTSSFGFLSTVGFADLLRTIASIVGIKFSKDVFNLLKESGTPFRSEITAAMKKLAIALLVIGALTGLVSILAAGVVWVVTLVFDYGCSLQDESDMTL